MSWTLPTRAVQPWRSPTCRGPPRRSCSAACAPGSRRSKTTWGRRARLTVALATDLARELDARDWPGADAAFLAVVRADSLEWVTGADEDAYVDDEDDDEDDDENDEDGWGDPSGLAPGDRDEPMEFFASGPRGRFRASRAALGDERVDAFLATLAPSEGGPRIDVAEDERVPDRRALAALLHGAGLPQTAAGQVAADAAWAIVLEPGGTGATRLGGLPVLPADTPWPTADGRPLTHLATIALAELPHV